MRGGDGDGMREGKKDDKRVCLPWWWLRLPLLLSLPVMLFCAILEQWGTSERRGDVKVLIPCRLDG